MDPEHVLAFWFGELDDQGRAPQSQTKKWFSKNSEFDADVKARFEATHEAINDGKCEAWLDTPRGRLAYVIVLDQLSRNMFRGTADMFASDARALRAALDGIDKGDDKKLAGDTRTFLYMPLMHSEDWLVQDRCVSLFEAMREAAPPEERTRLDSHVKYAIMHRDIIKRFGRFPHRNSILDRTSTPDEVEFLTEPNSAF
jgi:uncharacterized protein (DUF924 family)